MKTPRKAFSIPLAIMLSMTPIANLHAAQFVTIVQGLSGQAEYEGKFSEQNHLINIAAKSMTSENNITEFSGAAATRENLLNHFATLATTMGNNDQAVIYLIGHGSFDGEQYKFNIPGPDLTNEDLSELLANFPGQNHFLLNTSSTSGALLEILEEDAVTIITATRNGTEKNATEFGEFFAAALTSEAADINKNNNISIQEAFDYAEREVAGFFESTGRLATEHPQIRGEDTERFNLARINLIEIETEDPRINQLLELRTAIDVKIEELQLRRQEYSNSEYIEQLQSLILESAIVAEQIDQLSEGANGDSE